MKIHVVDISNEILEKITAKKFLDNHMRNKKSKDGVWRNIKGWEKYDAEQLKKEKKNERIL